MGAMKFLAFILPFLYAGFSSAKVHEIGRFEIKQPSAKSAVTNETASEQFPDYIHFEFQSTDNTFIFWLQRRSGLVGDNSRVVTHKGEDAQINSSRINGRPYQGIRLVVLKGKPTDKNGAEVLDDIKNPLARFFAYQS